MEWKKRAMSEMLDGAIRRVVVIGNGFAGAENQSIGLVRALGLSKRISLYRVTRPQGGINRWFKWLPVSIHKKLDSFIRRIYGNSRFQSLNQNNAISNVLEADAYGIAMMAREKFYEDGPLLVVASGRDTISVATSIKRLALENVFLVQIQHPRFLLNRFDLVITPRHDYYPLTPHAQQQIPWFLRRWVTPWEPPGRNVVLTVGALHQADSAALRVAASAWHDELATLPKPLLVVNIGGPTGNCPSGVDLAKNLVVMLQNVLWSCGTVRISFSRRTPAKISKILVKEFSTNPKVQIWDGEGPNPHMGHLAWADAFVITADSVSMLSEACSTGKPVYVIGAELCTWKFADFQNSLQKQGVARPFTGMENITESWYYSPLNDTAEAATQVIAALAQRGWTIRAQ
ncbi:mitochondrial fission protein ELM1 [Lathyrus oleraceus]|uniref:Serine/threonine protein kinase n=1 Tax=Pisum sativum TaxID=3888 RepID=A0A9D4XRW1_PEA|nr:mitochondrial fission protein ELM1-like [Pisum sativum]KAI5425412.1 serine/threonine protein kinase [Pisum sativum]